jgi:hypothetical protein
MGDLERLEREVRALRRAVFVLGACAVALGGVTIASCAHGSEQPPPKQLTFHDGNRTLTIDASGLHVYDGDHQVVIGNREITVNGPGLMAKLAGDEVSVFGEGIGAAKLSVVPKVGPRLDVYNDHTSFSAIAADTYSGATADNHTHKVSFEAGTDADLALETRGGAIATVAAGDHDACVLISLPNHTPPTQVCVPPQK